MDYLQIIVIVIGSGGVVGGLVAVATFIASRRDVWKKRKDEDREKDISNAVELRRLDSERANELYDRVQQQNIELEADVSEWKAKCKKCNRVIHKAISDLRSILKQTRVVTDSIRENSSKEDIIKEVDFLDNDVLRLEIFLTEYDEDK